MKKQFLLILILALCLALAPAVLAETLQEDAEAYRNAATFAEQVELLSQLAETHADELESGGWDVTLRAACAEGYPADLIPMNFDTYGSEKAETFPAEALGHKFLAFYIARDGEAPELAGEWLARFPKGMRAATPEEAEYAFVVEGWWTPSGYNYIPPASSSHRDYAAYVLNLQTRKAVRIWGHRNSAKSSGKIGQLSGDSMSSAALWESFRTLVLGEMRWDLGGGAALLFTPTGANCFLKGYEGEPVDVEVPAEVEGHPVTFTGTSALSACASLRSIVLPEGLTKIGSSSFRYCSALESVTLPSTLTVIAANAFNDCDALRTLDLPQGLQEIGSYAFSASDALERIRIPGSVTRLGEEILYSCTSLIQVIVEEGVTSLSEEAMRLDRRLAAVYLPASLTSTYYGLSDLDSHTVIYAPENSEALKWARENGREAVACAEPENMPQAEYVTEGNLLFRIFRGEAALAACNGETEEVTVPETAGGFPVTSVLTGAVYDLDGVRSVTLPESVREIRYRAVESGREIRELHVYIPNPDCVIKVEGIRPYQFAAGYTVTVHAPDGSAVRRYVTDAGYPENILFEAMGGDVDPNLRTLRDAYALAVRLQESAAEFWQTCDPEEYSLFSAVSGYEIGEPPAAAVLRVSEADLTDSALVMAGKGNALKMYATQENIRTNAAYARAASQTAQTAQLTPVADGVSAVVVLAYENDWILVSLMQDGNAQAILLTTASGTPEELTAGYVTETAAGYGVTGECTLYTTETFRSLTGQ